MIPATTILSASTKWSGQCRDHFPDIKEMVTSIVSERFANVGKMFRHSLLVMVIWSLSSLSLTAASTVLAMVSGSAPLAAAKVLTVSVSAVT